MSDKPTSKFEQMLQSGKRPKLADTRPPAAPGAAPSSASTGSAGPAVPPPPRGGPIPAAEGEAPKPLPFNGESRPAARRSASELRTAVNQLRIDRDATPASGSGGVPVWLAAALGVALAASIGWNVYTAKATPQPAADTRPSAAAPLRQAGGVSATTAPARAGVPVLTGSGKIVSDRRVAVQTKVSGQIVQMLVEQGDHVTQGQVIARIEEDIYRYQFNQAQAQRDAAVADLAQAQVSLRKGELGLEQASREIERAEAGVQVAEAELARAKAQMDFLDWNSRRLGMLASSRQASEAESRSAASEAAAQQAAIRSAEAGIVQQRQAVEVARTARATAEKEVAQLATGVDQAKAALAAAEAQLDLARKRLIDCTVLAPIAGVILQRNSQVGDFVAAEGGLGGSSNAQFVSIGDMQLLRVEVDLAERDIRRIFPGQPCLITPAADPDRVYNGYVMWIDPAADYAQAQVQVKVRILEPDNVLRVEGAANVQFGVGPGSQPAS